MIRYVLRCDQDHKVEAWFRNEAESQRALADGEPVCPMCERAGVVAAPPPPKPVQRSGRPAYQ